MNTLQQQGYAAKNASYILSTVGTAKKNTALEAIATILTERQEEWLLANEKAVKESESAGMRPARSERMTLTT